MTTSPTFLDLPAILPDGLRPRAAIFSAAHGSTYPGRDSSGYAPAAAAVRQASRDDAGLIAHWDFDLGGPLFAGGPVSCIDRGTLATVMRDDAGNRRAIEAETRAVLALGAVPILLGGDDSVVIPFLAGFAEHGPVTVLQIDAHLDWRDSLEGERFGYSSPMRRASEMPHVAGLVQAGLRGVGSARVEEVEAARAYGSRLVTARTIHAEGVDAVLRHIPEGARVVVTLDCDGLDPTVMPGVASRSPGGLSYTQAIDLIAGLAGRGARLVGFDLVEFTPSTDFDGLTATAAARILVNAIGAIVRQG